MKKSIVFGAMLVLFVSQVFAYGGFGWGGVYFSTDQLGQKNMMQHFRLADATALHFLCAGEKTTEVQHNEVMITDTCKKKDIGMSALDIQFGEVKKQVTLTVYTVTKQTNFAGLTADALFRFNTYTDMQDMDVTIRVPAGQTYTFYERDAKNKWAETDAFLVNSNEEFDYYLLTVSGKLNYIGLVAN